MRGNCSWQRQPYGATAKGTETCRRSEEHTSELQSQPNLVCRLLLEKKKQCIPHDAIVDLRAQRAAVERDARAPGTAGLNALPKTTRDIVPGVAAGGLVTPSASHRCM